MANAFSNGCCDGVGDPSGTTPLYRQARLRSDNSLTDVWLPVDEIPLGPADFDFYNPEDEICYLIHYADTAVATPGAVLQGWQAIVDTTMDNILCMAGSIYYQARWCGASSAYQQTIHAGDNTIQWFNGMTNFPAGTYRLTYIEGAMKYSATSNWRIRDNTVLTHRPNCVTTSGTLVAICPGNTLGYTTQVGVETANAGAFVDFAFAGGAPLGVRLIDDPIGDNVAGSPNPTFQIERLDAGELVDLYQTGITIPYYFKKDGVGYRMDSTSPTTSSPGTTLSGETATTGCDDAGVAACLPEAFPAAIAGMSVLDTIDFSGCWLEAFIGSALSTSGSFTSGGHTFSYTRTVSDTTGLSCPCPNHGGFKYTVERTA